MDAMTQSDEPNATPPERGETAIDSRPARPKLASALSSEVLGLSLGVQIGTVLALTVFAGMYSLFIHELRIAAMIFLTGITFGLVGGMVTALTADAHFAHRHNPDAPGGTPASHFWTSIWDGIGVGLGILLGSLPISLSCSLLHRTALFPGIVYVLGGIILVIVGVVRATSWRALPSTVAYVLLPGLAAVLLAHAMGDMLCKRLIDP
jgi:hypothetical protein